MHWIAVVPVVAVALGLLLVPGALILWPLRIGVVPTVALAGVLSVFAVGLAGVLAGAVGLRWASWQLLVPTGAAAVISWLIVRPRWHRPTIVVPHGWWRGALLWVAAGAVIAVVAYGGVASPARVSQTYDNVFHMSAIAAILDGRNPSSLTLRTLIETAHTSGFYPAAWHTLAATVVQLTGADAATAVNALWIATSAAVWIPGVVWLAQVLLPDLGKRVVSGVAVPLATGFAAMPYALLSWGTLYPTFLATSLLPAAVAVTVVAGRRVAAARGGGERLATVVLGLLAIVASVGAIVFAQPRVLASWALVLLPAAAASTWRLARDAWRRGGRSRRRLTWSLAAAAVGLVIVAVAGFWYLVRVLGLFERPLADRLGGPQAAATQSVGAGLWQVLVQSWPTGVGETITFAAVPLALAVLAGLVWTLRSEGPRWILVSYASFALLYALAAGSDSVFSKLATGIWYKDRYRLASVVAMLAVVLATRGIVTGAQRVLQRRRERSRVVGAAVGSAWAIAAASAVIIATTGITASVATAFRLPESEAGTAVVSAEQIAFFGDLPTHVPEGQRVLGDPWDGAAWTQLFGDREPVFPHVNGQWDADRLVLAQRLQDIETDPAVCEALRRLNVRYVVYSRHELGGGDPAGNLFPGPHRAVEAGLFAEVAASGETSLHRIDQCGDF